MKEDLYAQVILDLVSDAVDKPFQYFIPEELRDQVEIGTRVLVPFRSKKINAYIVAMDREPVVKNTREIINVVENNPILLQEFVELSYWVSRRFFSRWIEAIHLCLPPGDGSSKTKYVDYIMPLVQPRIMIEESENIKKKALRQALILEHLAVADEKGLSWEELKKKTGAGRQSLLSLREKGFLKIQQVPHNRVSLEESACCGINMNLKFSVQQQKVWEEIKKGFSSPEKQFLLYGITGSGKTELYLRAAEEVLKEGRTALFLVPEIALTPQIVEQFSGRFAGKFALLHSSLSQGERYDQWLKVKNGEALVVLGARSSVFAPLKNIGLIVMDEEHENTYKQDDSPRYHTRDVAKWRAAYHDAVLLMGSATPSLESYLETRNKKVKLLQLTERPGGRHLPKVQVVDMRREFKNRNKGIFSHTLWKAINETLSRDEQVILFLNRRGFSSFQLCRQCGCVVQCPSCSVSLTYHSFPEHLQCHYCGYRRTTFDSCPNCKSLSIRSFGLGTQKVEKEVKSIFPTAGVIRMDSDALTGKGAYLKVLSAFKEKKASILIGTQMVAKGFDFPGVTLVGVIAADTSLHLPDFRAGERTFQLLSQVAGRAGRGEQEGRVIIQTFTPWHYSIKAAASHDYLSFIEEELNRRKQLLYPPFSEILLFNCSSPHQSKAKESAEKFKSLLMERLLPLNVSADEILGPSPAPLEKVKDRFRYHILYKGAHLERNFKVIRELLHTFRREIKGDVRVTVDFNPLMML
ncbi:MAG: primosomal protein N' [Bacillota bacterium]|nr:primosomal protein N' [Bacillota bacterium]